MQAPESINSSNNNSTNVPHVPNNGMTWDDATWILQTTFTIFTMQSGFGLLESGFSSRKNQANIMVKNAVDVVFGGLSYWLFGFGLSFGNDERFRNGFVGIGLFAPSDADADMGLKYSWFIFQLSFATTSTTIVSGAMSERVKLSGYILFSFINTIIFVFPAHWLFSADGFLYKLGAIDIAGAGPVHLVGGMTGLVSTLVLRPRLNRFSDTYKAEMACPTNAILGMFMLWWGNLGFVCGSTYGISQGRWKLAARSAVNLIMATIGGGTCGITLRSTLINHGDSIVNTIIFSFFIRKYLPIEILVYSILAPIVSITGICVLAHPWQALVIGAVSSTFGFFVPILLVRLRIDDPVGIIPVHLCGSVWSLLNVGLFTDQDNELNLNRGRRGLFMGGGFELLGIQSLTILCITIWTIAVTPVLLLIVVKTTGLRCSEDDEIKGLDWIEHRIGDGGDTTKLEQIQIFRVATVSPSENLVVDP